MSKPKVPKVPGGPVPIIGQTGHQYMIGGIPLGFAVDPDQMAAAFKGEIESGTQLPHLFIFQWQRTAMHFSYHDQRLQQAEGKIVELEKQLKRLRQQLSEDPGTKIDYAAGIEAEAKN